MAAFVGFGFGPIQSGLFLYEAQRQGTFDRLVVAEVDQQLVTAVRENGLAYGLNIATPTGLQQHRIEGVELFNPLVPEDRRALVAAIGGASAMATALPSIDVYTRGVADLIAEGIATGSTPAVIYTAENNNHAAEALQTTLAARGVSPSRLQCLNTVIGKMSKVESDAAEIAESGLLPITPSTARAFVVESFSRILVSRITLEAFNGGIEVFEEKDDLLPFEEAKLFGHNAAHALLGYLLLQRGATFMSDARRDEKLMAFVRAAFFDESSAALCAKHAGVDPFFQLEKMADYVDDLMNRMVNPHLRDTVARITRDPQRKLGWDDRLIGTMRLVLSQGLQPARFARGARAALAAIDGVASLDALWPDAVRGTAEAEAIKDLIAAS
ncbi:MAG: hypothetical protein O3A51_07250 [Verrucomicrobia bacterium]|nr:hypothetical protein [Verrucomicrobiota bacterium]